MYQWEFITFRVVITFRVATQVKRTTKYFTIVGVRAMISNAKHIFDRIYTMQTTTKKDRALIKLKN